MEQSANMNAQIQTHPNFNADDLVYLTAKGWTQDEILARWDLERREGKSACRWDSYGARAKLAATLRTSGSVK